MAIGCFGYIKPFVQKITKFFKGWLQKEKINRGNTYISWGLGIESPFSFSKKFSINHQSITINGFQTTHKHSSPIRYSIVKISKLGTSVKYFDSVDIYGNYLDAPFKHSFQIPSGSDYQLEVFNYYKFHSTGKVQIIQNDQ